MTGRNNVNLPKSVENSLITSSNSEGEDAIKKEDKEEKTQKNQSVIKQQGQSSPPPAAGCCSHRTTTSNTESDKKSPSPNLLTVPATKSKSSKKSPSRMKRPEKLLDLSTRVTGQGSTTAPRKPSYDSTGSSLYNESCCSRCISLANSPDGSESPPCNLMDSLSLNQEQINNLGVETMFVECGCGRRKSREEEEQQPRPHSESNDNEKPIEVKTHAGRLVKSQMPTVRSFSVPSSFSSETTTIPRVTLSDFSTHHHHSFDSDQKQNLLDDSSLSVSPPSSCPSCADMDDDNSSADNYVTLEDVEKFRASQFRRRTSNASGMSTSSSFKLNEDAWSYTNTSLTTSDDFCCERLMHNQHGDNNADEEIDFATFCKASGWRKVRHMVQWTPFIQTFKHRRYQWVQLAGHSGNFKTGQNEGTILKKLCRPEEACYEKLMKGDSLEQFVPKYQGTLVTDEDEKFIQLQDCLSSFCLPSIMDCKIGVRTYLEEELEKAKEKPKLRKDMYEKMLAVDPEAPTDEENEMKAVTKPRYMVWRETISSTATLGFRIEGVKSSDGTSSKDFKTTKTKDQVVKVFKNFINTKCSADSARQYLAQLLEIRTALSTSNFFKTHELIGSSLLFIHDEEKARIWLIDFGKTVPLPEGVEITHGSDWEVGNHEDGYLIGIGNLIDLFRTVAEILEAEEKEEKPAKLAEVAENVAASSNRNSNNDEGRPEEEGEEDETFGRRRKS